MRGKKHASVERNGSPKVSLNQIRSLRSQELRKLSPTKEALDCQTNSPCPHLKKCMWNSMENMQIDGKV